MAANRRVKQWYIYALTVPISKDVRYIGITSQQLEKRLHHHMRLDHANKELAAWIASVRAHGLVPLMAVLETVDGTRVQAEAREREYIYHYLERNADLLNTNHLPGDRSDFRDFLRGRFLELFVGNLRAYLAERRHSL